MKDEPRNNGTVALIVEELTTAYIAIGRNVSKENALVVAMSLQEALKFSGADEVREAFRRAKDMADVPTQRFLREALANYRAERAAYVQPASRAPRLEHAGAKLTGSAEKLYFMATQRLAGIYYGMDEQAAKKTVAQFEADPRNREVVEYQRGWLAANGAACRARTQEAFRRHHV